MVTRFLNVVLEVQCSMKLIVIDVQVLQRYDVAGKICKLHFC